MVKKINSNEYLKRYDNMTAGERSEYESRVGEWLRSGAVLLERRAEESDSRLHSVIQVSVGWNDRECQAFEEGVRLLSALVGIRKDTWLPDLLYGKAVRRTVRHAVMCLGETVRGGAASNKRPETPKEEHPVKARKETDAVGAVTIQAAEQPLFAVEETARPSAAAVPARPRHIDQYAHLLPEKTQKRAAKVKDLLRELDSAREKARLLMDSPQASPDDRAAWAKRATVCDIEVKGIYRELDAEWEKLVRAGRVVVDDLGNARVVLGSEAPDAPTDTDKHGLTSDQKARRRELRKWLIDTRRGAEGKAREKRIGQWKTNIREYLTLEPMEAAMKDEKLTDAARHYGIEIGEYGNEAAVAQQPSES